jgi:hypothetical protein
MRRHWRLCVALASPLLLALLYAWWIYGFPIPHSWLHRDVGSQMRWEVRRGRYDDAVDTGLRALRDHPEKACWVYGQIAWVYLARAAGDRRGREQWSREAAGYADRLLLASKGTDLDRSSDLMFAASIFGSLGSISDRDRCAYYRRAWTAAQDSSALFRAPTATRHGKIIDLAPLKQGRERFLAQLKAQLDRAGCQ